MDALFSDRMKSYRWTLEEAILLCSGYDPHHGKLTKGEPPIGATHPDDAIRTAIPEAAKIALDEVPE